AMGRADAVLPWLEHYQPGLLPRPAAQERIAPTEWRAALGRTDRTTDWMHFFEDELRAAPWREVAIQWTATLSPAICASAMHGVIRAGHAMRSLLEAETPARIHELAEGLGYWAACHQTLPTAMANATHTARPRQAIARVPVVPQEQRRFTGTIVSS